MNTECLTIIRWTTNNPGASPEHYGVVHYGTDLQEPDRDCEISYQPTRTTPRQSSACAWTTSSRGQLTTTRSVREEANGTDDGAKSAVKQFFHASVNRNQRAGPGLVTDLLFNNPEDRLARKLPARCCCPSFKAYF